MDIVSPNYPQGNHRRSGRPRNPVCCTKCGETDPTKFYYTPKGYRNYICKKCACLREASRHRNTDTDAHRAKQKEWVQSHPNYSYRAKLRDKYGLTEEDYQSLLADQNGVCKVCSRPPDRGKLHVDHCHHTGKIRGLLCGTCNRGLGMFKDDPALLHKAAKYLEE